VGKVVERIRAVNWGDIELAAGGARRAAPRSIEAEALIDTGAGLFYLQTSLIKKLGLRQIDTVRSRTMSNLLEERRVFSPIELRIAGRTGIFRVVEIPDALPNLIGQIPLEELDLVVDSRKRRVVPNPEHPDGPLHDEFCSAHDDFAGLLATGVRVDDSNGFQSLPPAPNPLEERFQSYPQKEDEEHFHRPAVSAVRSGHENAQHAGNEQRYPEYPSLPDAISEEAAFVRFHNGHGRLMSPHN